MSTASLLSARPVYLTREGSIFRLAFAFNRSLVERCQQLPFARFDGETKSWTTQVCAQSVDELRKMYYEGLVDVAVDELLGPGEDPEPCREALLRPGSRKRPYHVITARRDDNLYARFTSIAGAQWDKGAKAISYPATAAVALAELVERGLLEDPERLLRPAEVVVYYDARTGLFSVRGDPRAAVAFDKYFPGRDVVAAWLERQLDVAFADAITEEIYHGELARAGAGLQPDGLRFPLYNYQASAAAIAVERSGICLVLEMGLGKTVLAIGLGHELVVNRRQATRTVCVVPAAVRTQWAEEIHRFTGAEDVVVVSGDKKRRQKAYERAEQARWVILPFSETLSRDYKLIGPLVNGAVLIADEAHRLRNYQAKRSKVMRQLGDRAARRYALTGTPVDTNPGDLYGLANWTTPGILGNARDFMNRYSYPQIFGDRQAGWSGKRNIAELAVRARPLYIRHTIAEVAPHLPPLRVVAKALDPDAAYAAALRRAHTGAAKELKDAAVARVAHRQGALSGEAQEEAATGAEMTATMLLRLLTSSPRLITMSDAPSAQALVDAGLVPDIDGPKLDELRVQAAEVQAAGQRLVVFTFSKRMAYLIAERFGEDGIRHVLFTGDTSARARDTAVRAFNAPPSEEDPGPTAFIATDAGNEGLNLGPRADGGGASILVNFDLPWTPGVLAQRSARIRRVDSVAPSGFLVLNYWLTGTLEHGILRLLEQRSDLQSEIFGERAPHSPTGRGRFAKSLLEEALASWRAETGAGHGRSARAPAAPGARSGGAEASDGEAPCHDVGDDVAAGTGDDVQLSDEDIESLIASLGADGDGAVNEQGPGGRGAGGRPASASEESGDAAAPARRRRRGEAEAVPAAEALQLVPSDATTRPARDSGEIAQLALEFWSRDEPARSARR